MSFSDMTDEEFHRYNGDPAHGQKPLIGEVSDVVKAIGVDAIATSIENARLEQELICGYPLVVKSTRETHMRDAQGRDIYEIYATFEPAVTDAQD